MPGSTGGKRRGPRMSWKLGGLLAAALVIAAFAAEALASPSPPKASVADRTIQGGVEFDLPTGGQVTYTVQIKGSGGGPSGSNCTRDEVGVNATQRFRHRYVIHFVAKNGGSCAIETSYSNFDVTVSSDRGVGTGKLFLGQDGVGQHYQINCKHKVGPSQSLRYTWTHLSCVKTSEFELKIT